ncbi:MAG TPA: methyltransferase [Polyangiales bacterium]|nr:methyltransferase [Polyangiales bacterium]
MDFDHASRSVLSRHDLGRFPSDTLFDRLGRACCEADCLPRKELYESWHVAKRVRRRFRTGRIVDLACGHGLTAFVLALLERSEAIACDARLPASAHKLYTQLRKTWPIDVSHHESEIDAISLCAGDLVVSTHACGTLTDRVLARAIEARARVAVLPCCHDSELCDDGGLRGWLDPSLAIDVTRAAKLRERGYSVHTQTIPREITPKNRLLLAEPLLSSLSP